MSSDPLSVGYQNTFANNLDQNLPDANTPGGIPNDGSLNNTNPADWSAYYHPVGSENLISQNFASDQNLSGVGAAISSAASAAASAAATGISGFVTGIAGGAIRAAGEITRVALPANNGYVYPLPAEYRQINAADKPGEGEGEFDTFRDNPTGFHRGIDILAPTGTPVYAVKEGTATVLSEEPGGAGLYVNVEHRDGTSSQYFHLDTAKMSVGASFEVRQGEQIGTVGRSGNTPPEGDTHLHFQVSDRAGTLIDPKKSSFPGFERRAETMFNPKDFLPGFKP